MNSDIIEKEVQVEVVVSWFEEKMNLAPFHMMLLPIPSESKTDHSHQIAPDQYERAHSSSFSVARCTGRACTLDMQVRVTEAGQQIRKLALRPGSARSLFITD